MYIHSLYFLTQNRAAPLIIVRESSWVACVRTPLFPPGPALPSSSPSPSLFVFINCLTAMTAGAFAFSARSISIKCRTFASKDSSRDETNPSFTFPIPALGGIGKYRKAIPTAFARGVSKEGRVRVARKRSWRSVLTVVAQPPSW